MDSNESVVIICPSNLDNLTLTFKLDDQILNCDGEGLRESKPTPIEISNQLLKSQTIDEFKKKSDVDLDQINFDAEEFDIDFEEFENQSNSTRSINFDELCKKKQQKIPDA